MLNNFIYSKTKELFEEKLASNEVLDESIVFIEDTKEIWNHGTYFGGVTSGGEENVQSDWNVTDTSSDAYIMNKPSLATVATSGSYNDLSNKPTIPSAVTESTVSGWGFTKNTGTITGITMNGTSKGISGVVNLGTVITAHQDISGKQDKLVSGTNIKTVNGTSLLGSGNIVISGGGGDSGGSGAYSEVNHGTSDTTFTLTPNVFHIWDEVASLTLTLGDETAGVANEFLFQFNSGSTATTLTLPDTIKWANDETPTIEANKIYQISILKGLASVLVFDNTPNLIDNIATYSAGNMMSGATLTFQYPVASDLTIALSNAASGSMTISSGETSITIDWFEPTAPSVLYIDPASDSVYNYILA